ncbi:MAG TPA: ABC transporter ATP-binding protein [Sedimentisphaerales bacterium]|nr:ATP-binding cassette domain-containing protein [Phycisphaerae bacterium]HON92448.1 ABC transporter ATP-binding protein [Sedimentisphaerales bacterium]HQI28600.1 ABC transporter ATP-binding protein [Sedimentisphaerales bacterium]
MSKALEAKNVEIRFGDQAVLQGFSLSLEPGEKVLLTGPSGCGKSTVLRCFLGFVVPDAGSVSIDGVELTADTVWRLRQHVAYVGQEPDLGTGTAVQAVERPFHYRVNAGLKRNLDRIPELFERFHLGRDLLQKDVSSLSGGEKQRIALVSAILLDRRIFLLDEITSALDKVSKQSVADYFRERDDAAALIVAHDPEVFSFVRRIIELPCNSKARDTA